MKAITGIIQTLSLAFVLFCSNPALARQPEPVVNIADEVAVAASGKPLSANDVQQVIVRAAQQKNWTMTPGQDGKLNGSLSWNGNKHTIFVEIVYFPDRYSITYKDSINMKYGVLNGVPTIHPYYNRHVNQLRGAIRSELMRL